MKSILLAFTIACLASTAAAGVGTWTTNGGGTWRPLNDALPDLPDPSSSARPEKVLLVIDPEGKFLLAATPDGDFDYEFSPDLDPVRLKQREPLFRDMPARPEDRPVAPIPIDRSREPQVIDFRRAPNVTEFNLPVANSGPYGITMGPDGNLWFTENKTSRIGRITPQGEVAEFLIPSGSRPAQITSGSDGYLWFTDSVGIGRLATDGAIIEFPVATRASLEGIAVGSDGNIWVTEDEGPIRRMTPSGQISEFPLSTASTGCRCSIAAGPDGNLWFTDPGTLSGSFVGRITTAGAVTEFLVGSGIDSYPFAIAAGPDGNMWATDVSGNAIWRITTSGDLKKFTAPELLGPFGIAAGPDGNLWYTAGGHKDHGVSLDGPSVVGQIAPDDSLDLLPLTPDSVPAFITGGPDHDVWFTEFDANKIARISPLAR